MANVATDMISGGGAVRIAGSCVTSCLPGFVSAVSQTVRLADGQNSFEGKPKSIAVRVVKTLKAAWTKTTTKKQLVSVFPLLTIT